MNAESIYALQFVLTIFDGLITLPLDIKRPKKYVD